MKKTRNVPVAANVVAAPAPQVVNTESWEWSHRLSALVAGLVLIVLAVFLAGVREYAQHGDSIVHDMDRAVADVAHEQAIRYERAGDFAKAKECYLLALQGRFDSPKGRCDALMRLGRMLRWQESPDAGLPYLREATNQPGCDVAAFAPFCDALMNAGKYDELARTAPIYMAKATEAKDDELRALAKYYEGKALLAQGQKDAALQAFIEAETIKRGGLSACEAGELFYNRGDMEKAKLYLETCVYSGGSDQSEYAAVLLKRVTGGS